MKSEKTKYVITIGSALIGLTGFIIAFRYIAKKTGIEDKLIEKITDVRNKIKLLELHPEVRKKAIDLILRLKKIGIEILLVSAYRDCKEQNELYAKGRTKPGSIVTNAKCGESDHNVKVAFDAIPIINGKATWNAPKEIWNKIGAASRAAGLKWGGDWKSFKDLPHHYDRMGKTRKVLMKELNSQ